MQIVVRVIPDYFCLKKDGLWPQVKRLGGEIPKEFSDPLFTRLFLLAEINNFTSDEYDQYKKSLENMSDWDNIINSTAERSREEGREEGRAEGIAETVRKMLASGIPAEVIADALDITVEECLSYRQ